MKYEVLSFLLRILYLILHTSNKSVTKPLKDCPKGNPFVLENVYTIDGNYIENLTT
jgi:hypothetical protein